MDPTAPFKQCVNTALLICCQVLLPDSVQIVVNRQSGQSSTRQQVCSHLACCKTCMQQFCDLGCM